MKYLWMAMNLFPPEVIITCIYPWWTIVAMLSHHILFKTLKLDFYHARTHDYASHFFLKKKKLTDVNPSVNICKTFLKNRSILYLFPINNQLTD